jgi:hypothetical protein
MAIDGKCGLAGAIARSKVSFDGGRLYVWVFDEECGELRQMTIMRICEVIDTDTGEPRGLIDIADWFTKSRLQ